MRLERKFTRARNKIRKGKNLAEKYDPKLKGRSYDYFERDKFDGVIVTPENRNAIKQVAFITALKDIIVKQGVEEEDLTDLHRRDALITARNYVLMNQKAEKAYNKGHFYFRYKGEKFMVPTVDRAEDMKNRLANFQEKYAEEMLEIENQSQEEE